MAFGIKLIQNGVTLAPGTAVHPAPVTVAVAELCYLSFTGPTVTYEWALPIRPAGSGTVISNATSAGPTILTDIDSGSYSVTFTDSSATVYTLDIVTPTTSTAVGVTNIVEVSAFGGPPDARYFHTDGKWYTDSSHTVEATDDAPKFIAAVAYAATLGGGDVHAAVHFGAGDWYFRNAPTGAHGEYVVVPSGITVFGDGDASCIHISPGRMTGASNTGYACVFGNNDTPSDGIINHVRFRDFRVDHNSKYNQMNATGGAGLTYPFACTILVAKGTSIHAEGITTINHAGRFGIGVIEYGYADLGSNAVIDRCHFLHEGDDPKTGDTSVVFCSATNAQITNCIVDANGAENIAWPNGNVQITAFEIHSSNGVFSNNIARDTARLLNLAGDSLSQNGFLVQANIGDGVRSGITLYQLSSNTITNLTVVDNIIKIRQGTAAFGEVGIAVADPAALSLPDGNGTINAKFSRNQIIFTYTITTDPITGLSVTPGPTSGHSYGMNMLGIANRVEISENLIVGFGTAGILWNVTTRNANSGNLNQDMWIHDNVLYRPGSYGIFLGGKTGESSPVLIRTRVERNRIIDDRGGSSALTYGIYVNGYPDAFFRRWWNEVLGAVTADYFFDTGTYPSSATLPETTSTNFKVVGTLNTTGAARIGNAGTALQTLHVDGTILSVTETIQNGDNSGAAMSWASNVFSLNRDTGAIKSTNAGTTVIGWSNNAANLGFYGVTPVGRATAYTQTYSTSSKTHPNQSQQTLTDNSGGSASTTLAAITGGAGSCQTATKDAVASLAARLAEVKTDVLDLKKLVNAMIDDDQAVGLKQ